MVASQKWNPPSLWMNFPSWYSKRWFPTNNLDGWLLLFLSLDCHWMEERPRTMYKEGMWCATKTKSKTAGPRSFRHHNRLDG
jgi:hypothetical protein